MADMTMSQLASKVARASQQVTPTASKRLAQFSVLGSGIMAEEIQRMHAVDTGTMLNSIDTQKVSATEYEIGPTVEYATYVAHGTSRMKARPFHITSAHKLQGMVDKLGFSAKEIGL